MVQSQNYHNEEDRIAFFITLQHLKQLCNRWLNSPRTKRPDYNIARRPFNIGPYRARRILPTYHLHVPIALTRIFTWKIIKARRP